jgi:hypothetical protein
MKSLLSALAALLLTFPAYAQSTLYWNSTSVGVGTNAPTTGAALDLSYNTNSVLLPVGTTGQRPTGVNGMLRLNSSTPAIEAYYGGTWNALGAATAINTVNVQTFPSSGTYTPTTGTVYAKIDCWGGAGGGGGTSNVTGATYSGAGGGAGGHSADLASAAQIGSSQTVTVGAAGNGGAAGANNGSSGGNSSVGTHCTANGGSGGGGGGGNGVAPGIGGAGGGPGAGTNNIVGAGVHRGCLVLAVRPQRVGDFQDKVVPRQ